MAPTKMQAVVTTGGGDVEVAQVDVPKPGSGQILVKVYAAAQNPIDWRVVQNHITKGSIVGCDFAGTVEEIGPDVPEDLLKVGDRVCSFVHGNIYPNGAFAEYTVADAQLAIHIPSTWSFEEAAQGGVAGFTTCQSLYHSQDLPTPLKPASSPIDILVWAGSTSVGQYVIQFAHLAGLRVITTSSPKNFDLVKSLGADLVFSYSDPETPEKIKEVTGGKLKHAVDCISADDTPAKIAQCFGDEDGVVSIILPYESQKPNLKVVFSLTFHLFGKAFDIPVKSPVRPDIQEFGVKATKLLTEIYASDKFKTGPVKVFPKGLASVKDGLKYMKEGKVSGEKLTYVISDTPK